jgi:hypothetical protein
LRIIRSLVAVGAVAATASALAVAPAMADPVNSHFKAVKPAAYDIVGVGAGTDEYLFDQLSVDYNKQVAAKKKHSPSNPYIYSWDATPPNNPLDETQQIVVKSGCKKNLRPNGSNAGITALGSYGKTSYTTTSKSGKKTKHTVPCVNFARSSSARSSKDPALAKGGIAFVALAKDAVTYAATKVTNVPSDLSLKQLQEIFSCSIPAAHGFAEGTWGALLGSSAKDPTAKPDPLVPQPGSGTLTFWMETALGFTEDSQPSCGSAATLSATKQPEENEGISKLFLLNGKPNPNVLFPYSVGSWIAQEYHSKTCGKAAKKGQNNFGCDENGVLYLNKIGGTAPTVKTKGVVGINSKFDSKFQRLLYDVVPFNTAKSPISSELKRFFGQKGWFCLKAHDQIIKDYGYLPTPLCGVVS